MVKHIWVLLLASAAFAQPAVAVKSPVAFEVASVKVAPPPDRPTMGRSTAVMSVDDARARIANATLGDLINIAFRTRPYQVTGPEWLRASGSSVPRFTVEAKLPDGAGKDRAPEMLQTLLAERFHLVFHREDKEWSVFALVVGKGGSKLHEVTAEELAAPPGPGKTTQVPGGNSIHMERDMTVLDLCELATRFLDRPVVDMTDMKGRYHMLVELSTDDMRTIASRNGNPAAVDLREGASDPTGGTIFQSVQAMGLKLEPRKITGSQLVIDRLEKSPVEN